jgi:FKBP-type peptidyl-prolyl cis-trans isomerase
MKQTIFTLFLFCAIGLFSCRKDKFEPTIKQYDQTQITNYIAANGITGMVKDTVGGDTTGTYYKIITPGTGAQMAYTDQIAFVFTIKSFDGKYSSTDTINNHFFDYLGHVTADKFPEGIQLALINDLKYPGASARILVPSHLAFGVNGYGSGSVQTTNTHIAGNQCLDYYIHVIGGPPIPGKTVAQNLAVYQAAYDDQVIKNYMKDSSLTNYTKTADGLYYKIITPGTGTDPINYGSTIGYTATGQLFNAVIFDDQNVAGAESSDLDSLIPGVQEGLTGLTTGAKVSLLIPSALGYGTAAQTTIPANSCLRFTFIIDTVTP